MSEKQLSKKNSFCSDQRNWAYPSLKFEWLLLEEVLELYK